MNKLIFLILCVALLFSCTPNPEFYINGKPCYTRTVCTQYTTKTIWIYHYGYNIFRGKYEYHYGPTTVHTCVSHRIDTIFINK